MTTWKHAENSILVSLYGLATKKKFMLESLIFMTGFRNFSYVLLVHLNVRFCMQKDYVFIERSVGLYEWVCLPFQYFILPCKRAQNVKWKAEFDPYHVIGVLFFLFQQPFYFSSLLTFTVKLLQNATLGSTALHEKRRRLRRYLFTGKTCSLCVYICTADFSDKHHSWMNVTERNLECTFHCKSAPNVLTKCLDFMCSEALKVTRLLV